MNLSDEVVVILPPSASEDAAVLFLRPFILRCIRVDIEMHVKLLIKLKDARQVFKAIAVVWRTPNSHKLPIELLEVPFHTQLVCSQYLCYVILVEESIYYICSKHVTRSSRTHSEASGIVIWITPHEISKGSFMRYLLKSLDFFDVSDMLNGGR